MVKPNFLERNKKKSLLAALLLFLRERKALVLLLLLVLIASTVFLSPSAWITGLPGGARLAASVAWVAGKMGVDVSKYGLGPGKRSFGELTASFAAAKANAGAPGVVGWGAFMGKPAPAGAGGPDSVGYVKGSQSDLQSASAGTGKRADGNGIAGAVDPAEAKRDPNADAVAVDQNDMHGEREGLVKNAFAGGFVNGLMGSGNALSGGAFAGHNFFSGNGRAASGSPVDAARKGMEMAVTPTAPNSRIQGAAKGKMSAQASRQADLRWTSGQTKATNAGGRALGQLAAGRLRADLATGPNCQPPSCPGEFAATNTGAIYDGNQVAGIETAIVSAPQVDGITAPNIPQDSNTGIDTQGLENMDSDAKKCQENDNDPAWKAKQAADNQNLSDQTKIMQGMSCDGGGCSHAKADACRAQGQRVHDACAQLEADECSHMRACRLTANKACGGECSQASDQNLHAHARKTREQGTNDKAINREVLNDTFDVSTVPEAANNKCYEVDVRYDKQELPLMNRMITDSENYFLYAAPKTCDASYPRPLGGPNTKAVKQWQQWKNYCAAQVTGYNDACRQFNAVRCDHLNTCSRDPNAAKDCASQCSPMERPALLKSICNQGYGTHY